MGLQTTATAVYPNGINVKKQEVIDDLWARQTMHLSTRDNVSVQAAFDGLENLDVFYCEGLAYQKDTSVALAVSATSDLGIAGVKALGSDIKMEHFGGGVGATGTANSSALLRIFNYYRDKGVTLEFENGTYLFDDEVLPDTNKIIHLKGHMRGTVWSPTSIGSTTDYMLEFGAENVVSLLRFTGIEVAPVVSRSVFNGVLVHPTNQLRVEDCFGRNTAGTAWNFQRAHNSSFVRLRTFHSGHFANDNPSILFTGTLGDFSGKPDTGQNDIVFDGCTTEDDELGVKIEEGLVVRTGSPWKVHGGADAVRSMHIHNITNGQLDLYPTFEFSGDEQILITDDSATTGAASQATTTVDPITKLDIRIHSNKNSTYMGTGTGSIFGIDVQEANSQIVFHGSLSPMDKDDAGATITYFRIKGAGTAVNTVVDISNVVFPQGIPEAEMYLDDRATNTKLNGWKAPTGLHLPFFNRFLGSTAAKQFLGNLASYEFDGAGDSAPVMRMLGICAENANSGTEFITPYEESVGEADTVSTSPFPIVKHRLLMTPRNASANGARRIRSVQISAKGIPATFDAANHWELVLYSKAVELQRLVVTRTTTAAAGDGQPNRNLNGRTAATRCLEYNASDTSGLEVHNVIIANSLGVQLEAVGSPPNLTEVFVSVQHTIVN